MLMGWDALKKGFPGYDKDMREVATSLDALKKYERQHGLMAKRNACVGHRITGSE